MLCDGTRLVAGDFARRGLPCEAHFARWFSRNFFLHFDVISRKITYVQSIFQSACYNLSDSNRFDARLAAVGDGNLQHGRSANDGSTGEVLLLRKFPKFAIVRICSLLSRQKPGWHSRHGLIVGSRQGKNRQVLAARGSGCSRCRSYPTIRLFVASRLWR